MLDSRIKELPEFVINQIKAGEVIERPSQLFKEIIENSIDALSKNIDIKIRNNGLDLIQISDDGVGMSLDELPLAFKRHATSKINQFSDIYEIYSYGFRGEALASISAVSKVSCRSRQRDEDMGGVITLHGGKIVDHHDVRIDRPGTTLAIENLFYNTPVRLKFLKSLNAEKRAIQNILQSFLISWPQIRFTIQWDDEEIQTFPATEVQEERISRVMFKKKQAQDTIIKIEDELDDIQVKAYLSPNGLKGGFKKQYLFVNGRLFIEKPIHFFITKQLEPIWGHGLSGHYIVFISIPSDQIDVNIHPSKTQIKFEDDSIIYSLMSKSFKIAIAQHSPETNLGHVTSSPGSSDNFNQKNAGQLKNESSPSTASYRNTQFGNFKNSQQASLNSNIIEADSQFFIFKQETQTYLISKEMFLRFYVSNYCLHEETKSIPLIISDPFKRNSFREEDVNFFYHNLKIEFEIIDEELMVLRSIPHNLSKLPYKKMIESYLQNYLLNQKIDPKNLSFKEVNSSFVPHQLRSITEEHKIDIESQPFSIEICLELFKK